MPPEDDFSADIQGAIRELEAQDPAGASQADPGTGADPAGGAGSAATQGDPLSPHQQPGSQGQEGQVAPAGGPPATGQPSQPGQQPGQPSPAVAARAPVGWKPLAREKWSTVDPSIQEEVLRREREIDTTLRTTAEARKHYEEFGRAVQPYMHFFAQENSTPMQGFSNYLQTAAMLRTGSSAQKADVLAHLAVTFGVDVNDLDTALSRRFSGQGGAPSTQTAVPPNVQAMIQQHLQPYQSFMQTMQARLQEQNEQVTRTLQGELEEFATNPENEFFNDVREDMADLLELAAKQGRALSLQEAYKRATLAHPQIAEVIASRQSRATATKRTQAADRALNAAVSLAPSGAPADGGDDGLDDSLRSDLIRSARAQRN